MTESRPETEATTSQAQEHEPDEARRAFVERVRARAPAELRERKQWVAWKFLPPLTASGKPRKMPCSPATGEATGSDKPDGWGSLDEALARYERGGYTGVGFVFTADDPYVGVDFDKCRNPATGELTAAARAVVDELASYTEASVSGTGIHVIAKGELPPGGRKNDKAGFEMYESGRYFVFTGDVLEGRDTIVECTEALRTVHVRYFGERREVELDAPKRPVLSDEEIIDRVLEDEATARLFAGKFKPEHASQNTADLALCKALAALTADAAQIDGLFRQSGLMRPKWDTRRTLSTYGKNTVNLALAHTGNGPIVTNYSLEKGAKDDGGDGDEKKPRAVKLPAYAIAETVLPLFDDKLVRLGGDVVLDDEGEIRTIQGCDALFLELQLRARLKWQHGRDKYGENFLSRGELLELVESRSPLVSDVSLYPLYPKPADVYVSSHWEPDGLTDGSHLEALLDFFAPETEHDRALLKTIILSFFWGGKPGGRPFFVLCAGNGAGKSSNTELLSSIVGGAFAPAGTFKMFGDGLAKELLSDVALQRRVVLFDNLEGTISNREMASLLTSGTIQGRASHREHRSRVNRLTWIATSTQPSFDSDLATRSLVITMRTPEYYSEWEPTVREFITTHRADIIADAITVLRGPRAPKPRRPGRFAEWCGEVLAVATKDPDAVLEHAGASLEAVDADKEAFDVFLEHLRAQVDMGGNRWSMTELAEHWNRIHLTHVERQAFAQMLYKARRRGIVPAEFGPVSKGNGKPWAFLRPDGTARPDHEFHAGATPREPTGSLA